MHPNPAFRQTERARALAFAKSRGFGVLSVNGANHPITAHVPFVMADDTTLLAHLVASNPLWRLLQEGSYPALLTVSGPDGYISPDWYGHDEQVPTWNYVAVNLTGQLEGRPQAELRQTIDALSVEFERRLAPKPAWTSDKMDTEILARMMRQIRPIMLHVEGVESTFKLNQNKPQDARLGAADALAQSPIGMEIESLATLMREDQI